MYFWLLILSGIAIFIIGSMAFMQLREDIKARKAEKTTTSELMKYASVSAENI